MPVLQAGDSPVMQRRRIEELWRHRDFRAFLFLAVLAAITVWLAYAIRGILGPFIIAAILALVLNPAVNAAEKRKVPRTVSVLILYAVIAIILVALGFWLNPIVRQEFSALVAQGPAIAGYLQDLATSHHIVSVLGVPFDIQKTYTSAAQNLPGLLAGQLSSVVQNVFMLFNWLFQLFIILLVGFFLVKDAHIIRRFFESLVPHGYRTDAQDLARDIYRMLGAYMRGQFAICALVGVVTGIAMWIVGVPYSLALGIVAGVTAFIPFIGPLLGAIPGIAVSAFVLHSTGKVVVVIVIYFLITNIIYNFVSPKVFGNAVHLTPMLVIIAFVVGGYLGGILGLFVAVPVAATARILFRYAHERVYA